jgi:death-on-curing protein
LLRRVRSHGNKRTAFVAVELFLELNGEHLTADDQACVLMMLAVAAGDIDDPAFGAWIADTRDASNLSAVRA